MVRYVERLNSISESYASLKVSDDHYSPPLQSILTFLSSGTPDETTSHEDDSQLTFALRTSLAHGGKFVLFYLEVRLVNTGRHRSINRHQPVLKN